jgi:hypothetical protein
MRRNIVQFLLGCLVLGLAFTGCEKHAGDYTQYLGKAEGVFPGRPVSMTVSQGYNKAALNILMSPDPRVTKMRIYWNNRRDSIETIITASDLAKNKVLNIPSIQEGVYTFEAVTFDAAGKRSVTLQKTASILGNNFTSGLFNRVLKSKILVNGANAVIWYSETDTASIMAGVKVTYPLKTGGMSVVFTPKLIDTTLLTDAMPLGKMIIKTAYLPKNAIDTFYSKPDTLAY